MRYKEDKKNGTIVSSNLLSGVYEEGHWKILPSSTKNAPIVGFGRGRW